MEESMETALARLRAKTDQELGILIARQLRRSRKLAARGAGHDAAREFLAAKALLTVAAIPPAERGTSSRYARIQPPRRRPALRCCRCSSARPLPCPQSAAGGRRYRQEWRCAGARCAPPCWD